MLRYEYNDPERQKLFEIDTYQRKLIICLYHGDNEEARFIQKRLSELIV